MSQLITILCLILLAVLIFRFPELGLVLCLTIGSFFKGLIQPLITPIDITVYLFAVTFGSIVIRSCMERKLYVPDLKTNIPILLFTVLLLASLFYTPLPEQGVEVFLRFVFLTISMLYATYMWCNNISRAKRLLFLLIGIVLVYGLFAFVWVFLLGKGQLSETRAPFPDTPVLGIAQLLAAAILITLVLFKLVQSKSMKMLLVVLTIVGVVELVALNSRGPLIAFIVGAICLFVLYTPVEKKRLAFIAIPATIMIVLTFAVLPSAYTGRYALVADIQSDSIAVRLNMWQFIARHFTEWFFSGAGLFGFGYYYNPNATEFTLWGSNPHNIFLDVFASVGFFGLIVFMWLIVYLLYVGIKTSRSIEPSIHLLALATVTAMITFLVADLFSAELIGTRPIWFFGGVLLSLYRLSVPYTEKTNPEY